jgi:hypothetical protein
MSDQRPEAQERPPKAEETSERATQKVELYVTFDAGARINVERRSSE